MRFALAGGTVALVYLTTTTVLAEVLGVPFQAALATGFAVGLCVHFTLQRLFVWRDRDAYALALHHQLARYLILAAVQYGVTAASTAVLPSALGVSSEAVYVPTVLAVTAANFLIFRNRVFHRLAAPADAQRVGDGGWDQGPIPVGTCRPDGIGPNLVPMSAGMERAWRLGAPSGDLEEALTAFIARKLMKVTRQTDAVMEVRHGSTLAIDLGGTLDWLPIRARIWHGPEADGGTRVQAHIQPRGRPRIVRRQQIADRYQTKMSSWLEQLDATLRATAAEVQEITPVHDEH